MSETEEMIARGRILTDYAEAKKQMITLRAEPETIASLTTETETQIGELENKLKGLGVL